MENISHIGLDVHKNKIVAAESKRNGHAEIIGEYENNKSGFAKMVALFDKISKERIIKICYEAGPCGYQIKRQLAEKNYDCEIAAPSLIPIKSGERIKTDKRDAKKIARYYRAGELTFINVPTEEQESVRDLVRCREDLVQDSIRSKQRLNHFLIRHGLKYEGTNWTKGYINWIRKITFKDNFLQKTLAHYFNTYEMIATQLEMMDKEIAELAETEPYKEKVNVLRAYNGIETITAMILLTEIVDFRRFSNPKELMAYLGMVPGEYSSGDQRHQGKITKAGNIRARKSIIVSSWKYQNKPFISPKMRSNLSKISKEDRVTPVKALMRLNKRFYHLQKKGKIGQKVVVSVGRELIGFIWYSMIRIEERRLAA